ncbi:uncharacterized protein V6R79_023092 [Siganus canaliculatus]
MDDSRAASLSAAGNSFFLYLFYSEINTEVTERRKNNDAITSLVLFPKNSQDERRRCCCCCCVTVTLRLHRERQLELSLTAVCAISCCSQTKQQQQ